MNIFQNTEPRPLLKLNVKRKLEPNKFSAWRWGVVTTLYDLDLMWFSNRKSKRLLGKKGVIAAGDTGIRQWNIIDFHNIFNIPYPKLKPDF